MAAKTLSEFSSRIKTLNVVRPYQFYVEIAKPSTLVQSGEGDMELVNMFCSAASTPMRTMTTKHNYDEAGINRKYVYDYNFTNLILSFYIDQTFNVKNFFDSWFSAMVINKRNFGYYDDYVSEFINVNIINQQSLETYSYQYNKAIPIMHNQIILQHDAKGQASFNVEFAYETVEFYKITENVVEGSNPELVKAASVDNNNNTEYQNATNAQHQAISPISLQTFTQSLVESRMFI